MSQTTLDYFNTVAKCKKCGKTFGSVRALKAHLKNSKEHSMFRAKCDRCGKEFTTERAYKVHIHGHELERYVHARNWIMSVGAAEVLKIIKSSGSDPENISRTILEKFGDKEVSDLVRENFEDFRMMLEYRLRADGVNLAEETRNKLPYIS